MSVIDGKLNFDVFSAPFWCLVTTNQMIYHNTINIRDLILRALIRSAAALLKFLRRVENEKMKNRKAWKIRGRGGVFLTYRFEVCRILLNFIPIRSVFCLTRTKTSPLSCSSFAYYISANTFCQIDTCYNMNKIWFEERRRWRIMCRKTKHAEYRLIIQRVAENSYMQYSVYSVYINIVQFDPYSSFLLFLITLYLYNVVWVSGI